LNEQKDIPITKELEENWVSRFAELSAGEKGAKVLWGLVDGFLLYWHQVLRLARQVAEDSEDGYHARSGTWSPWVVGQTNLARLLL
jgi:hypothetical protein